MRLSQFEQQARVTKVQGSNIEIDHGDGSKTTVDTSKNPNAITKDATTGKVSLNKNSSNSSGNQQQKNQINTNDQVEIEEAGEGKQLPNFVKSKKLPKVRTA